MSFTTFISGVNTSFSTELNDNSYLMSRLALYGNDDAKTVSYDFSSDQATVKTNLTYDADEDVYFGSNASVVLEMPSKAGGNFEGVYDVASLQFNYTAYTIYDECNDSSFNTTNFTASANAAEDTVKCEASDTGGTDVTLDADNNTAGWSISQKFLIRTGYIFAGSGDWIYTLNLVGVSSGSVALDTTASGSAGNGQSTYEIYIDTTNDLASVYENKVFKAVYDVSGLSGNYYLQVKVACTGAGADATSEIYYVRIEQGDESSTATKSFSSDGGNNYTASVNGIANLSGNTNYATRIKLTSTVAADEIIVIKNCSYIPVASGNL